MWIKLIGASFKDNNIGTLTSHKVDTTGLVGLNVEPKYVSYTNEQKTQTKEFIITPLSGYVLKADNIITCTHSDNNTADSHKVTEDEVTAGKVVWTITLDSNIAFAGAAEKVETGGGEDDSTYTFTINPTPSTATVILTASGYTQSGNSITVPNGTTVSWSVSASGYTTQTGTWIVNGSNKTENIILVASGGESGNEYNSADMWVSQTISSTGVVSTSSITQSNIMAKSRFVGSATITATGEAMQMALVTYNDDGSFKSRGTWDSLASGSSKTYTDSNPFNVVIATKATNTSYTVEEMVAMLDIVGTSEESLWDGTVYSDSPSYWVRQSMDSNGNIIASDNATYNRSNLMAVTKFNESIKITAKSIKLMTALITYDDQGNFLARSSWDTPGIGASVTYSDVNPFNVIIASSAESSYSLEEMLNLIDVRSAE